MKPLIIFLLVAGVLAACNDSSNGVPTSNNDTPDTLQEAVVDEELTTVRQSFPQLFQYLIQQDSTFSADSFSLAGEAKVEPSAPAPLNETQLQPFRQYLIYNEDSTRALDLYSYNYVITNRDGRQKLEEAGPDAEAALIDFKNKTRKRVFFGGPSQMLWDAKWTGTNKLLLVGAEAHDDKIIPTIWDINLKDTSIQVYAYQGDVTADMTGYLERKQHMGF